MGTRSLTFVHESGLYSPALVCMYRQLDGYPEGHGKALQKFLKDMVIVDGIGCSMPARAANGMSCLAAQLVAYFKNDYVGSFYLYSTDSGDTEDYNYHIYLDERNNLKLGYYTFESIFRKLPIDNQDSLIKYSKIAEFVYKSRYWDSEWKWRKIRFVEIKNGFLSGYDLNDENKFKKFMIFSILNGKVTYTDMEGTILESVVVI